MKLEHDIHYTSVHGIESMYYTGQFLSYRCQDTVVVMGEIYRNAPMQIMLNYRTDTCGPCIQRSESMIHAWLLFMAFHIQVKERFTTIPSHCQNSVTKTLGKSGISANNTVIN